MILPYHNLRTILRQIVKTKEKQGHVVAGLMAEIDALPDSYDAIAAFEMRLRSLPLRPDWPHREPNELPDIWDACDPDRPTAPIAQVDPVAIAPRVENAFLSSVCGCILGKPIEINPDLPRIRAAAEAVGCWPLTDYLPEKLLVAIGGRHGDWVETVRENIRWVAPDDDINYTILGMMVLEAKGVGFSTVDVAHLWNQNVPPGWSWGPERAMNARLAQFALVGYGGGGWERPWPVEDWAAQWNPNDEACGALIRADAYGYACPGNPALAAELAWRDARLSHRRTGIYGTMFTAAAIATAFVIDEPLEIFRIAAKYVPRRSRFRSVVDDSLAMVAGASDWLDGYRLIHGKYREFQHCGIYQEIGTVINTLRFAGSVDAEDPIGAGIGMQVGQGNDTDSFGCTAGSILGAYFGPGKLAPRWLAPFNDTIHCTLATVYEQRLSAIAKRMGRLPARLAAG